MRQNPVHLRVFGKEPERLDRRLRRFFDAVLPYIHGKGVLWGAYVGDRLIGVLGALPPRRCAPMSLDLLRMLPNLLMSPAVLVRLYRWLDTWRRNDLPGRHWHIGPLAVEPSHQGRGVGTRLLDHCFAHTTDAALYLETDTEYNVGFYGNLGFKVLRSVDVLGAPTWLMRRDAAEPTVAAAASPTPATSR